MLNLHSFVGLAEPKGQPYPKGQFAAKLVPIDESGHAAICSPESSSRTEVVLRVPAIEFGRLRKEESQRYKYRVDKSILL